MILYENNINKIPLSSLKKYEIKTKEDAKKYSEQFPGLKRNLEKDIGTADILCTFWANGNELVGCISVDNRYDGLICNLEVMKRYRRKHLADQILDYCIKHMGGKTLDVKKTNTAAVNLYKKHGFKFYHEDDSEYYHMTIDPKLLNK